MSFHENSAKQLCHERAGDIYLLFPCVNIIVAPVGAGGPGTHMPWVALWAVFPLGDDKRQHMLILEHAELLVASQPESKEFVSFPLAS